MSNDDVLIDQPNITDECIRKWKEELARHEARAAWLRKVIRLATKNKLGDQIHYGDKKTRVDALLACARNPPRSGSKRDRLMRILAAHRFGLTAPQLARMSGESQDLVANYLFKEKEHGNVSIDKSTRPAVWRWTASPYGREGTDA